MKFRILPNLLEIIIKQRYEIGGFEDLLPNQVLNVDPSLEAVLNLDPNKFRAGRVNSEIISGSFKIPVECLDLLCG